MTIAAPESAPSLTAVTKSSVPAYPYDITDRPYKMVKASANRTRFAGGLLGRDEWKIAIEEVAGCRPLELTALPLHRTLPSCQNNWQQSANNLGLREMRVADKGDIHRLRRTL